MFIPLCMRSDLPLTLYAHAQHGKYVYFRLPFDRLPKP